MKHYVDMLDVSNNKARVVLYSLAKRFNGTPRIETNWRRLSTGNFQCALNLDVNGFVLNCGSSLYDVAMWFDEDKLSLYIRNKYRHMLSLIVDVASKGKDIMLGNSGKIFVRRGTSLEQLFVETDLIG